MEPELDVQYASECGDLPKESDIARWAEAALEGIKESIGISVRIVDEAESAELNRQYRNKSGPTNVLSFPFEDPPGVKSEILGDLVICAPVVSREAQEQNKPEQAHWAHMVVHGIMHLRGYDHINDEDAGKMEKMETTILTRLGFDDPYA
ncbi:MAG: rRNA maturation RNase YbeY [Gammaproteobacteria bacterium]|nr:rRNA maturation RNase YbeY [Gammaproteobacteria bacterium]